MAWSARPPARWSGTVFLLVLAVAVFALSRLKAALVLAPFLGVLLLWVLPLFLVLAACAVAFRTGRRGDAGGTPR